VVVGAFQIAFRAEMHANDFFYFLKIIFDISTSKRSKKYKPHSILAKKKIQICTKHRYKHSNKRSLKIHAFYVGLIKKTKTIIKPNTLSCFPTTLHVGSIKKKQKLLFIQTNIRRSNQSGFRLCLETRLRSQKI